MRPITPRNAHSNGQRFYQRSKPHDQSRKCSCCQKTKKYHDYLPELREERLQKQRKK